MISKADIEKLATLSRLSIPDAELDSLQKDIEGVLSYVEKLKGVAADISSEMPNERNVLREDGAPHESGAYTEAVLRETPASQDGYVKVKKILG